MCTATWSFGRKTYDIFFNRDELRSRLPAAPPETTLVDGIRCILPLDRDAGGTWILANEAGFSACLLNYYGSDLDGDDFISRGLLVSSLGSCSGSTDALQKLGRVDLSRYRYFSLLLLDLVTVPTLAQWAGKDGLEVTVNPDMPLSSSSYKTDEVIAGRIELYQKWNGLGQIEYHRSHIPDRGPYSVCMHRPDAHTVSFSHVAVSDTTVEFSYTPGSPCKNKSLPAIVLARTGS